MLDLLSSPHLILTVKVTEPEQPGAVLLSWVLDEPLGDALQHLLPVQDHDRASLTRLSATLQHPGQPEGLILIKLQHFIDWFSQFDVSQNSTQ